MTGAHVCPEDIRITFKHTNIAVVGFIPETPYDDDDDDDDDESMMMMMMMMMMMK